MKKFTKLLALVLIVSLLISTMPITSVAAVNPDSSVNVPETEEISQYEDENESSKAEIVSEIIEKREANIKHFRMSDGSITAAYYPGAVHYKDENGDFLDIDNTLSYTTDDTDEAYGNKENSFSVKFMKKSNKNKLYTITKNNEKIKVAIEGVSKVDVEIIEPEDTLDIDNLYSLENITSKAIYHDIFENADLEYILSSDSIKENLILKSTVDFSSIVYNYKIGNKHKAVAIDEKTVDIVDREGGELIFRISAPTMWDSAGNYSDNLTLKISEETNTTVKITLSWDNEFLKTAIFPVTVDPVQSFSTDRDAIEDTHIHAADPGKNYNSNNHVRIANRCYTLLKFPTPDLNSGDKIVKAQLSLVPYGPYDDSLSIYTNENSYNPPLYITTHKILRYWDEKEVTYNSADHENGFYDDTVYSYRIVDGDDSVYTWDITRLANEWTEGGVANYGIFLKYDAPPADGSTFDTFFCSTNGKWLNTVDFWPQIIYQYINTTGVEDYYSYHTQNVGAAGTIYTNDLTGNLTLINPFVTTGGSLMPLTATLVYNSNNATEHNNTTKIVTPYSAGWNLNWAQKIDRTHEAELGYTSAKYIDADGTEHYFNYDSQSGLFIDETDKKRWIIWNSSTQYNLVDETGVSYLFIKKNTSVAIWYLTKIIDPYGNYIDITLNSSNYNRVDKVVSSTGNVLEFVYNSNNLLEAVKYKTAENTYSTVTVGYNTPPTTNGAYSIERIGFADGKAVKYYYTYIGNTPYLVRADDIDGYNIRYQYTSGTPARVKGIYEYSIGMTLCQQTSISYQGTATTITDVTNNRKYLYTFSALGTLTSVVDTTDNDGNGYGQYYQYNNGDTSTTQGKGNLTFMSKTQKSTVNLINNHSYEYDSNTPVLQAWAETTNSSSGGYSTEKSHIGLRSYKLTRAVGSNSTRTLGYIFNNIVAGNVYTLSAYVNTSQMTSLGKGASLLVIANNTRIAESEYVTETKDEWQRISVTFTAPATASITISVCIVGATGSVYFDNIQFEQGGLSDYNLLENAGFEYNNAADISGLGGWSTYDSNLYFLNEEKISGNRSAKFVGGIHVLQEYYQCIKVPNGKSGDTYVASAFAKAKSVPAEGYRFSLLVRFVKGSYAVNECNFVFNSSTTEWQKIAGAAKAKGAYDTIVVWLFYQNNCNTVYFDNAQLIKDTFGNTYTYDSQNNLISTVDLQGKAENTFQYNSNNQLIKETSVSGSKIEYNYNSTIKQRIDSVKSGGVTTAYTYDTKGNVLSSTTYGGELVEHKYYYIRNVYYSKYLEVSNSGTSNGTNVIVGDLKNNSAQRWKFTKNSDGTYSISPECATNMLLSVEPSTLSNYANVALYSSGSAVYQHFHMNNVDGNIYYFDLAPNTNYSLDINSTNAYIYPTHHKDYQKFVLIPEENIQLADNPAITSSATYSSNGEYTMSSTDSRGETTDYTYYYRGMLNTSTAPNDTITTYSYNNSELLTKVAAGLGTDSAEVNYTYDFAQRLYNLTSPSGTVYNFTYDGLSRTTDIKLGSTTLSQYTYDSRGNLTNMLYGNGTTLSYTYDSLNRKTGVTFGDNLTYSFIYDGASRLAEVLDIERNRKQKFFYDILDRLTGEKLIDTLNLTPIAELNIRYDDTKNRVSGYDVDIEGNTKAIDYVYGEISKAPDIITGIKQNGTRILTYGYDGLNRQTARTIAASTPFTTNYTYLQGATASNTTTLLSTLKNGEDILSYTYDAMGNIETISKNGTVIESYTYDYLNQLKTVTNADGTYEYTYDNGGNILSVTLNGTVIKSYAYGNTNWKDLLTEFNGNTITYDTIGNPLTYREGMAFTWSQGRKLTGITKGTDNISYTYDSNGLRASKTVNSTTTEYYWLNGQLQGQKTGSEHIIFLYDENGTAYGFLVYENGVMAGEYYYLFNAQGDVIGIIDSTGTKVVEYTYNAWGELLSTTGTLASTIGQKNPLRYRGYYYDAETGFYYLQSRYYDPIVQRFINADGQLAGIGDSIQGYNLFAYCFNNPVNLDDSTGNWPKWLKGALNVVSGVLQTAIGITLGVAVGWTGVGAAAAGVLMANGVGTVMKGINQTVNALTKTNSLPEINVPREVTKKIGKAVGGETGGKVATAAYDATVAAASIYSTNIAVSKTVPQLMPKLVESKLFSINNGYGIKIGKSTELLYKNPNAAGGPGCTFISYKGKLGKFRIDWDPIHSFHTHPPGH